METIAIILAALKAGGLFVGEKVAGEAVKDSYTALKDLLFARVKNEGDRRALEPSRDLAADVWEARAIRILESIDAQNDLPVIKAAQNLLTQVNQTQSSTGKFSLQANTIGTVIQGDHAHVVLRTTDRKTGQG